METLYKILRSTITSLLYLILTFLIILQFLFMIISTNGRLIANFIDIEQIVNDNLPKQELSNEAIKNIVISYVDDYMDYVFYKKSYPSLLAVDLSSLDTLEKETAKSTLEEIQKQIDIDYSTILKIRAFSNFISNGSINLLTNIAIIFVYLILTIWFLSFYKSGKLFSISLITAGILIIILTIFMNLNKTKLFSSLSAYLNSLFSTSLMNDILFKALIYIIIGVIMLLGFYLIKKFLHKNNN